MNTSGVDIPVLLEGFKAVEKKMELGLHRFKRGVIVEVHLLNYGGFAVFISGEN